VCMFNLVCVCVCGVRVRACIECVSVCGMFLYQCE